MALNLDFKTLLVASEAWSSSSKQISNGCCLCFKTEKVFSFDHNKCFSEMYLVRGLGSCEIKKITINGSMRPIHLSEYFWHYIYVCITLVFYTLLAHTRCNLLQKRNLLQRSNVNVHCTMQLNWNVAQMSL